MITLHSWLGDRSAECPNLVTVTFPSVPSEKSCCHPVILCFGPSPTCQSTGITQVKLPPALPMLHPGASHDWLVARALSVQELSQARWLGSSAPLLMWEGAVWVTYHPVGLEAFCPTS